MKNLFSFLLLLFIDISVNAQCKLITEKDQYTGIESISTKFEDVGRVGSSGGIKLKLAQYVEKDTVLRLYIKIVRNTSRCIDANSKLLIKTESGVVALSLVDQKQQSGFGGGAEWQNCGREFEVSAVLSLDQIEILKTNVIDGLRVFYVGNTDEFTIINDYRDQYEYFQRVLKCFE